MTGLIGSDTVSYNIIRAPGEEAGQYAIIPDGETDQGNYTVTYVAGTFTIFVCTHEHTGLRNVKEATCTEKGYTGDTWCKDCEHKIADGEDIPVNPDNHACKSDVTREATIFTEGERTYTCTRCGHTYTEAIPRKDDGEDHSAIIRDTGSLSGDKAPRVVVSENEAGDPVETIIIGGEEVSKTTTDKDTGKETVVSKVWIGGLKDSYHFTGSAIKPSFHVYDGTKELKEKTDYTVSWKNNKTVGTATVIVKFKGNYKDTKNETVSFKIEAAVLGEDIEVHEIGVAAKKKGSVKVKPVLTWAETGKSVSSKYFSITPSSVTGEGTTNATITVKSGQNNYTGSATVHIRAVGDKNKVLANAKVKFDRKSYPYTGDKITPDYGLTLGGRKLTEGTDYRRVSLCNNTNPGTAVVVFEAISGNSAGIVGSKTATFKISGKKELKEGGSFTFTFLESVPYIKGGAKPSVAVKDNDSGTALKEGRDYTLSYAKNKAVTDEAKTAELKVKGKGNYKGSVTLKFAITRQSLRASGIIITAADQFTTRPKLKAPKITITDVDGKKLKVNADYTVGTPDTSDPVNTDEKGIVSVTVNGKGAYKAEDILVTFRYGDKTSDISKARVTKKLADQEYTGNAVKLFDADLTGILTAKDKTGATVSLLPGTDFNVAGYENNVKKGTAKVTVQGIGNFAGTKTLTFRILQKKVDYKGALVGEDWK